MVYKIPKTDDCENSEASALGRYSNETYDNVKIIADNIEHVNAVSNELDAITEVHDNLPDLLQVDANAQAAAQSAMEASASASEASTSETNSEASAIASEASATRSETAAQDSENRFQPLADRVTTNEGDINTLSQRSINTPNNSGLAGGGDLSDDRNLSVDISNTPATTVIGGTSELLMDTPEGLRRVTRDTLLQGVSGGLELRGSVTVSTNANSLPVSGDGLNSSLNQGTAPSHGNGVNPNGFTYLIQLTQPQRTSGVMVNMGGVSGSPSAIHVFHDDKLVWTGDQWQHIETGDNVLSVHGRYGVVTSESGDYNASQINNTPANGISSNNTQGAINELSSQGNANASGITGLNSRVTAAESEIDLLNIGLVKEADFEARRAINNEKYAASGFVHKGKHVEGINVNEGMSSRVSTGSENTIYLGRISSTQKAGVSKTDDPILNIAGVTFLGNMGLADGFGGVYSIPVKFPEAPDGTQTYNSATGAVVQYPDSATAFAAETSDIKVVTERVDMWGFESYLEEVSTSNPMVYPKGLIQSQATVMNDVATVSDNTRPITYFAVFDDDTTSRGRGVDWYAATDAQRAAIAADPENNIVILNDGRVCQWRLRQRTIAGAGNGDWLFIDSASSTSNDLLWGNSGNTGLRGQGASDEVVSLGSDLGSRGYLTSGHTASTNTLEKALYTCRASSASVNGECYFLVCGTVLRRNRGAWHFNHNPLGSARFSDGNNWYNTASSKASTLDCFTNPQGGSITSGISGSPDGRYFDTIYAGGQGGVQQDLRYSVYEPTKAEIGRQELRLQSGEYRGYEKAVRTTPLQASALSGAVDTNFITVSNPSRYSLGDRITLIDSITNEVVLDKVTIDNVASTSVRYIGSPYLRVSGRLYYHILESELPYSLGHQFTQITQYGNPSNLLTAFPEGWAGDWGGLLT